jgi:hypothetical protein
MDTNKLIMSKVTFVSALFDINRVDGRKWDTYLKWFDISLKLKVPMVIFITEDLVEFVEERRKDIPTDIIIQTVEDIPYYKLKDKIQGILDSDRYKEDISDPDRIECQQAMYSIIQYSKFPWLEQAIEKNPHESEFFFWIDAGASRFFEGYDLSQEYPSKDAVESLDDMGELFLVQMNCDYYPDLYNADVLPLDYLYDNRSYVLGSMFGGHKNKIPQIVKMIDDVLMDKMISKNNVNNEQIALGYLIKKYPDDFAVYKRTNGKHMDIFREFSE